MDTAFTPTFVIASDVRYDLAVGAGAGYLLIEPGGQGRRGACAPIDQSVLTGWGYNDEALREGGNPIAICEAAAVAAAMVAEAQHLQGAHVTWNIDNSAVLHSFVKGSSARPKIDRAAHIVHFLAH
eukprot:12360192-Heterocapsa_arctica.AAC.1